MFRFDREQFFSAYREAFGSLRQLQVEGLEFLLSKIEADPEWDSLPQIAYFVATIKHETGVSRNNVDQTYQPIKELRAKLGTKVRKLQDRYWGSEYYGRGYIQLTWKENYAKFGLADVPDDALQPDIAYMVAARGMREGKFTKHKLSDFVNDNDVDYTNARKVVNGLDRASDIAFVAAKFERILQSSLVTDSVTEDPKLEEPKEEPEVSEQKIEPPAAPQGEKPTVTPVEAPPTSITTKIAATAGAVGPVIAATGLKIGGVEFSTGGIVAISAVIIVGMILGAWIWNQSQERRERRQRLSMENLASDTKSNVIAAGSKV